MLLCVLLVFVMFVNRFSRHRVVWLLHCRYFSSSESNVWIVSADSLESVVKTLLRFKAILQVKTLLRLKANFQGHCGDVESRTSRAYDVTLCWVTDMSGTEDTIGSSRNFAPARVHMAHWSLGTIKQRVRGLLWAWWSVMRLVPIELRPRMSLSPLVGRCFGFDGPLFSFSALWSCA